MVFVTGSIFHVRGILQQRRGGLEGRSQESDLLLQGQMETQAPDIDGHVLINDVGEKQVVCGEFYAAEITESLEYDLVGKIV